MPACALVDCAMVFVAVWCLVLVVRVRALWISGLLCELYCFGLLGFSVLVVGGGLCLLLVVCFEFGFY